MTVVQSTLTYIPTWIEAYDWPPVNLISTERYPPIKWIERQQKIAMQAALTSIVTQLGAGTPPPERTDASESMFGTTICKDGFTMDPHRGGEDSVPPNLRFSDPTLHPQSSDPHNDVWFNQ